MADETREFIPKESPEGDRMLVFELASKEPPGASPPPPPPEQEPIPLAREPRRRSSRKGLLVGVAGAVALGAVLGVVARPDLIGDAPKMQPARPPAEAEALTVPQVQVMVRDEAEAAAPEQDPAEVAVEPQVASAPPPEAAPPEVAPPRPALQAEPPQQVASVQPRPAPAPRAAPAAPEPREVARARPEPPRVRPSFDCRYARSASEEMVCADPQLAAADRRLVRAYERAIEAGVPRRYLRAEQDDWLQIREEAARRSPRAVADIYDQRTAELNDMALEARAGF